MPQKVRLECPNSWLDNPIDGSRNLVFFSFFICCLAQKKIPISVETVEFGSDTAPRHPMGGEIVFSYHSREINPEDRYKVFRLKEAPIPPLYAIDLRGYSGWSEIAQTNLQESDFLNQINKIADDKANLIISFYQNELIHKGLSKYTQKERDDSVIESIKEVGYVFMPLQVPSDPVAQLCPFPITDVIVRASQVALEKRKLLVIKRHPFERTSGLDLLLDNIKRENDYVCVLDENIQALNQYAHSVLAVNSGASFEALLAGKSVWNIGTSEWWPIVNKICSLDEIKLAFEEKQPAITSFQRKYLAFLLDQYWVPNHDRQKISKKIDLAFKLFDEHNAGNDLSNVEPFELRLDLRESVARAESYRRQNEDQRIEINVLRQLLKKNADLSNTLKVE